MKVRMGISSKIPKFYTLSRKQKCDLLKEFSGLVDAQIQTMFATNTLDFDRAERLIENVVSVMSLPMGIASNFLVNDKDYFVPMVTEEPSVVAAASFAAKLAREAGGFYAVASSSEMTGQIVLVRSCEVGQATSLLATHKVELLAYANQQDTVLVLHGGGARDITVKQLLTHRGPMLVFHLSVDVKDAMGANIVNTMAEAIAPKLEQLCTGTALLKIVSNLCMQRTVKASAVWKKDVIGEQMIEKILDAYAVACVDQSRATTHNKGIMNGIDAVALATGNDTRALEAGAHSFAARDGSYQPLTHYKKNERGDLEGSLEIPLAVGIVGGMTTSHPMVPIVLKILRVQSAQELACIMGAVGLAQNFAALRALVTEGIQKGHMRLHSRKGTV